MIFYATIGEMCRVECFERIIVCWMVALAVNFSFGHNRHGHEGGTIDTGCVCVEWEGALVTVKWEPCRFQHQYLQCGAPVYPLRGLHSFLRDWAQCTMGAGTIATLLGCGAPCERYGARGVISVSSEPKPGDILNTGRGPVSLSYFRIIR